MFRCKECGCEFKTKPDYCDCGNDTFDEILPAQKRTMQDLPDIKRIASVAIFVLCIILAIVPWTIKDKTPVQKPIVHKAQPDTTEIPDIEKIWNSTPAKIEVPQPTPQPAAIVTTEPVKPVQEVQPKPKPVTKPSTPKQVNTPAPVPKPQTTKKETPKPVQQTKTAENTPTPAPVPKPQPAAQQQPKTQASTPKPAPKPVDMTPLIDYKNQLRIALLSKLNVPNIQGTGDCAVSFSIDANGKLLNRNFVYKSSNKSVNDEVYYMLMRLPSFKKPPEIYKGETIKLKFYINNGYYEISFI